MLLPARRRRSTLGAWLEAILDIVVAAIMVVICCYDDKLMVPRKHDHFVATRRKQKIQDPEGGSSAVTALGGLPSTPKCYTWSVARSENAHTWHLIPETARFPLSAF